MRIAVATPNIVVGDAVSNDVLGMARVLRQAGFDAAVAASRAIGTNEAVAAFRDLGDILADPEDVLIYHHSIGSEEALRVVSRLRCRTIVKYHNITPPHFYRTLTPLIAHICEVGIEQLQPLLRMRPTVWVDSPFNGFDLRAIQPDLRYDVLPPFNQVDQLLEIAPDAQSVGPYDDWNTNILVVGRVVPNKNIVLAVEAFAHYLQRHDPQARLLLVGDLHPEYCKKVLQRIRELKIQDRVVVTGKVTLAQLKALYLISDVLLTTSKHEGFCLPLIEAMALGVPLVAVANTAIPETAGEAAWYAGDDAASIAAALAECLLDSKAREARIVRGMERFQSNFRNDAIGARMLELLKQATSDSANPFPGKEGEPDVAIA